MAAIESCSCLDCFSCPQSPPTHERSVKRKLEVIEGHEADPDGDAVEAIPRVGVANECAALREELANQQRTIQELYTELEEERDASSTAANETMSMILRLQREKAELQMEARQFRAYADERMAQDQVELLALEEALAQRGQAIRGLSREVKTFRRRLTGCGVDPEKVLAEAPVEDDDYPPLKCREHMYYEDEDYHRYGSGEAADAYAGETPRVEEGICELEKKVVVGNSPRGAGHSWQPSVDIAKEEFPDTMDAGGEGTSDRVYMVDAVHEVKPVGSVDLPKGVTATRSTTTEEEEIKKLCMRLQALETDKESLKETISAMQNDKMQMELVKAIVQNLSNRVPQVTSEHRQRPEEQPTPRLSLFKWTASFSLWKKNKRPCRYSFGLSNSNPGLLLLVTQPPSSHLERQGCLSRRLG